MQGKIKSMPDFFNFNQFNIGLLLLQVFIIWITLVASLPSITFFFEKISMILGFSSVISISIVWSGSTSTLPER